MEHVVNQSYKKRPPTPRHFTDYNDITKHLVLQDVMEHVVNQSYKKNHPPLATSPRPVGPSASSAKFSAGQKTKQHTV
jgi:hypothetical protein